MTFPETPPVPSLVRWGISPDADLVYRTLTLYGPQPTARAARELGLPTVRVTRALDELAAIGAVTPVPGARTGSRWWRAAPLGRVLARVRRRSLGGNQERWRRHLALVTDVPAVTIDDDGVRTWPSRDLARTRIAELVRLERHEHLAINTEERFSADAAAAAAPLDRDLLARGVRVRILGRPAEDGDRSCGYATDLGRLGGEHREANDLPLKLLLYDRRVALIPADPDDLDAGAVEIRDLTVVERLCALFHRVWTGARDPRRGGVPPIVLTAREKGIVALLAAGHSEESVAAELRLSRRTVVYTLRGLMDRLNVENRFQLAMVLGATRAAPLPVAYRDEDEECSEE
jgi:DNA-binding CsgD family transcriptional regulator